MTDLIDVTIAMTAMMLIAMTARDELEEYGFSPAVADRLSGHIHDRFDDYVILAEETIGKGGSLTRSQLIFIESLYRSYNIRREREIWEGLKRAPERQSFAKRPPAVKREVVLIFGRRVVVYRSLVTGRFVRRRRRR